MRHKNSALFGSEICMERLYSIFCTNSHRIDIITTVLLYCIMVGLNTPIKEKQWNLACFTDTWYSALLIGTADVFYYC